MNHFSSTEKVNLSRLLEEFNHTKSIQKCSIPFQHYIEQWSAELERNPPTKFPFHSFPLSSASTNSFSEMKGRDATLSRLFLSCKQVLVFLITQKGGDMSIRSYFNDEKEKELISPESAVPLSYAGQREVKKKFIAPGYIEDNNGVVLLNSSDQEIHLPGFISEILASFTLMKNTASHSYLSCSNIYDFNSCFPATLIITPKLFFFQHLLSRDLVAAVGYLEFYSIQDRIKKIYSRGELLIMMVRVFINLASLGPNSFSVDFCLKLSREASESLAIPLYQISQVLGNVSYIKHILPLIQSVSSKEIGNLLIDLIDYVQPKEWFDELEKRIIPNCFPKCSHIFEATELIQELISRKKEYFHRAKHFFGVLVVGLMHSCELSPSFEFSTTLPPREWIFYQPLLLNLIKLLIEFQQMESLNTLGDLVISLGNELPNASPLSLLLKEANLWDMLIGKLVTPVSESFTFHEKKNFAHWILSLVYARLKKLDSFPIPDLLHPFRFSSAFLEKDINDPRILHFLKSDEINFCHPVPFFNINEAKSFADHLNSWTEERNRYSVIAQVKMENGLYFVDIQKTMHLFHSSTWTYQRGLEEIKYLREKLAHPALSFFEEALTHSSPAFNVFFDSPHSSAKLPPLPNLTPIKRPSFPPLIPYEYENSPQVLTTDPPTLFDDFKPLRLDDRLRQCVTSSQVEDDQKDVVEDDYCLVNPAMNYDFLM